MPHLTDHDPIAFPERSRRGAEAVPTAGGRLDLPLAWQRLQAPPSPAVLDAAEQSNATVLAMLLQGIELEARARPVDEAIADAIAPLRVKLEMVVGMLARLCYREIELPPRHALEFLPGRLVWAGPPRPRAGDWLRVEIYFDPVFREPVTLYGTAGGGLGDGDITVELVGVSERVAFDLARLAYLVNRRQRSGRAAEPPRRGA